MSALLSLLTGPNTIFAALFGAIVLAVISYARGRLTGSRLEKTEQARAEAKARDIANKIDDAVAGRDPDKNREALRKWGKS